MKKEKNNMLFVCFLLLKFYSLTGQTKTDLEKLGVKNKVTTFIEKTYKGKSYGTANDYKGELIKSKSKAYFFNAKGFLTQENIFKKEPHKIMYSYDKKGNLIKKTTILIRNNAETEVVKNIFSKSNLKIESNRYKGKDELVFKQKFKYDKLGNCIAIENYKSYSKEPIGQVLFKYKKGFKTEKLFINAKGITATKTLYSYGDEHRLKEITIIDLLKKSTTKKIIGYQMFTYNLGMEKTYTNGVLKESMTYDYKLNEETDWIERGSYKSGLPAFITERIYN